MSTPCSSGLVWPSCVSTIWCAWMFLEMCMGAVIHWMTLEINMVSSGVSSKIYRIFLQPTLGVRLSWSASSNFLDTPPWVHALKVGGIVSQGKLLALVYSIVHGPWSTCSHFLVAKGYMTQSCLYLTFGMARHFKHERPPFSQKFPAAFLNDVPCNLIASFMRAPIVYSLVLSIRVLMMFSILKPPTIYRTFQYGKMGPGSSGFEHA